MSRTVIEPSASHPITTEHTGEHVVVRTPGGTVLADTTDALALHEADYPVVQYVPVADVETALLEATDTATYCPYKGEASYSQVAAEPGLGDVLWAYEDPHPAMAELAGHVAFYSDRVQVDVTPA